MARLTGLLLFLLVSVVRSSHESGKSDDGDLQRKYSMVVNELEDMRATVTTMKEDMRRMKRVSRALDALCEELRSGGDTHNTNSNIPETEQPGGPESGSEKTFKKEEYTTKIQATSLQTNDDTFTVEYNSTVKAEVRIIDWNSIANSTFDFNVVNSFSDGKGVVSGLIKDEQEVDLTLTVEEYDLYLFFQKANKSKTSLPSLAFTTDVRRDIVFEEGKSASIEIKMGKENKFHFRLVMCAVSLNESETVMNIKKNPEIVNLTDVKEYLKHQELTVVVNEGKANYEGVLYLSFDGNPGHYSETGVHGLGYSQTINVIQSGHSKPFPDRFLGFVVDSDQEINKTCKADLPCDLHVTVMGDGPADITLWKLNGGIKTQIDVSHRNIALDYVVYTQFRIFNVSKSDAGLYMYRSTSHVGTDIEKIFMIKVYVPYVILTDQSTVLEDTSEILVVKCVGKGDHDPQIRFYNGSHTWSEEITEGPGVSIQFSDGDTYVSSATLTIDQRTRSTQKVTCAVQKPGADYPGDDFQVYTNTDDHY